MTTALSTDDELLAAAAELHQLHGVLPPDAGVHAGGMKAVAAQLQAEGAEQRRLPFVVLTGSGGNLKGRNGRRVVITCFERGLQPALEKRRAATLAARWRQQQQSQGSSWRLTPLYETAEATPGAGARLTAVVETHGVMTDCRHCVLGHWEATHRGTRAAA